MATDDKFLSALASAFGSIDLEAPIGTEQFCNACEKLMPIFDKLGSVFYFAKLELEQKRESIVAVCAAKGTLLQVVQDDIQAGVVTKKNSCGRNLHRLATTVHFVAEILRNLVDQASWSFKDTVSDAYNKTLGPVHTWPVRMAVKAGLFALPSKEEFLKSIDETEASAHDIASKFRVQAEKIVELIQGMYEGVDMPSSNVTSFKLG